MKLISILQLLSLVLFVSCVESSVSQQGEVSQEADNSDIPLAISIPNSSSQLVWDDGYTKAILDNFQRSDLSEILNIQINDLDISRLGCANYNNLSKNAKKLFWVNLFAAIAESESDFDNFNQTRTPGDGTMNIGLMQIDIRSANRHAAGSGMYFLNEDLFYGEKNLIAGMFIMRNQLRLNTSFGRIFPTKTYYWEVLIHPSRLINFFKKNMDQLYFCKALPSL